MSEHGKAHDARRLAKQSTKGNLWCKAHPGYDAERMRNKRALFGREPALLDESFEPIILQEDAVLVAGDWHAPFYDHDFAVELLDTAETTGIKTLLIPGDLWDCDNYSRYVNLNWDMTFKQEIAEVRTVLDALLTVFDDIYCCRGNHEKRWIDGNYGKMGMKELFAITGVGDQHVHVTLDDRITLVSQYDDWLICHPRSFRQINLSVAKDLCAKYRMNVFCAHGHQWAQGVDRSGHYQLVDGGGMFDSHALEYLRTTTTYPAVQGGFYAIVDGEAIPFKNERPQHKIGNEILGALVDAERKKETGGGGDG